MIRKKRKRRNRSAEDGTSSSAMIDIVFLLLIYFITTQKPIIEDTLLRFSPAVKGAKSSSSIQTDFIMLEVTADEDNNCLMNGQPVSITDLKDWLAQASQNTPDANIIILCSDKAKHRKLVDVMNVCRKSPLKKISLMAK